jgi:membrane-bound lytic murein transglycosylase MltF
MELNTLSSLDTALAAVLESLKDLHNTSAEQSDLWRLLGMILASRRLAEECGFIA